VYIQLGPSGIYPLKEISSISTQILLSHLYTDTHVYTPFSFDKSNTFKHVQKRRVLVRVSEPEWAENRRGSVGRLLLVHGVHRPKQSQPYNCVQLHAHACVQVLLFLVLTTRVRVQLSLDIELNVLNVHIFIAPALINLYTVGAQWHQLWTTFTSHAVLWEWIAHNQTLNSVKCVLPGND